MLNFSAIATRYEHELLERCIPFWERACPDWDCGGYFNFLTRDGQVFDTEKSMWMQWRIVYTFATLYTSEYRQEQWLPLAQHGYDFLTRHGKDAEGHYYFALNRAGTPSVAPYNIYSDCFAAMGAAALYQATGEGRYRAEAEAAMTHYLARIESPKGRWEKALTGKPARRTLGHYMMQANLGFVLNACLGTDRYVDDIRTAAHLVLETFWQPEHRLLFENVNRDGAVDLTSCDGRHINPGHGLEAMWFILQYALQAGDEALIAPACEVVRALLDVGWDPEHGGLFYFMDACGLPHQELQWDMKLWWVHNEALLAALYAYKASGDPVFLEWFERLDAWTWARFPDPEHGEWYAYLNRRGEVTHTLKGGRWKCFFHLPRCLLFGTRLLREQAEVSTTSTNSPHPSLPPFGE
jgi:N-acylglucosamine 2-epimerase